MLVMLKCMALNVMPGWLMLVMLMCAALNVMPWAADADDAHVCCVERDAFGG